MELWEKKLRNAIRTEIRGLVNEGKLDLSVIAENLELDVSDLLSEADQEAAKVVVDADADGVHVEVTQGASQAGDSESFATDTFGDVEATEEIGGVASEVNETDDAEDVVVAERWQRLAGLIRD